MKDSRSIEDKVKLVIKLIEKTNGVLNHRKTGETFAEHKLKVDNSILWFINEWEKSYEQPTQQHGV